MTRGVVAALLLAVSALLQATVLNRMPLPWGVAPDLLLVVLVGLTIRLGPAAGVVAGFAAGLAMDALPPADTELGRSALVLCAVGYATGSLSRSWRRSRLLPFGIVAVASVGAGLGHAAIAVLLGDPGFRWASVLTTLPFALLLTMLLSPLALYGVSWVMRRVPADLDGLGSLDLDSDMRRWGGGVR